MKRLLLPLLAALALPTAVNADLGGADLQNSQSGALSGNTYEAWCGVIPKKQKVKDRKDCLVKFKDNRLIVDDGKGILKDQLLSIKLNVICDVNFWWNTCAAPQELGDKRYTINYQSSKGKESKGIITLRDFETDMEFRDDLQIWMGEELRDIGPIIKISS